MMASQPSRSGVLAHSPAVSAGNQLFTSINLHFHMPRATLCSSLIPRHLDSGSCRLATVSLLLVNICVGCWGCAGAPSTPLASESLRNEALATLRQGLNSDDPEEQLAAAELLLDLGYSRGIAEQLPKSSSFKLPLSAEQVTELRVLAKAIRFTPDYARCIEQLLATFRADDPTTFAQAACVLAELRVQLNEQDRNAALQAISAGGPARAVACHWLLAVQQESGPARHLDAIFALRSSSNEPARQLAAEALRHLGAFLPAQRSKLLPNITAETLPQDPAVVTELCRMLAEIGEPSDLPLLGPFLNASTPSSTSFAAASAILRIERRSNRHRVHWLDWLVIFLYAAGMIGVGFYYSRRNKSRDDYLLGGRSMSPWMVGLSLFATIISTISFLAYPGELVRYGPLVFSSAIIFPLCYILVGWWLIPALLAKSGTSGYALLEERLGLRVRLLGAAVFILLRLVWMATVIYATTTIALLPALDIDPAYTPLVCAALGLVTLGYTALGGLRAVVLTDVIQSFLLFAAAIATIALVTIHFGGVSWFPTSWPAHWAPLRWGLGLQERMTITNASIFMLAWYICTCGSDQMAIQRFKATGGTIAARHSFGTTLIAAFLVKLFLGVVGVAVMAYFLDQPHLLPDKATVITEADKLFPAFIVIGIPVGLTGLVISGMMAAAMSSLSSGISAVASVISDDFLRRFRPQQTTEHASLIEERIISAVLGAVVVALSLLIEYVPGNLFEITSRVVNTFTAPLFILFFMALFVPWATPLGAVVGLLVSLAVAIAIAFFEFLNISMMWIIPASMLTGILAGTLTSLFLPRCGTPANSEPAHGEPASAGGP